jgi:hypothetical protein
MAEAFSVLLQDDPEVQGYADSRYPNASGGPRLNKARFCREVGATDTTVERWYAGCSYMDDEPLVGIPLTNPITGKEEPTFAEADARRINTRKEGIRKGRWRDGAGSWLSEARAGRFLKRGLKRNKPKRYSRLLCETPIRKRSLLHMAELWEHKRAELDPKGRCSQKLVRRAYNQNWYSEEALTLLKGWLTMPPGHYGTTKKPRLDVARAAKYVGCDKRTIQTLIADGTLKHVKDWSRNGRGEIKTVRVSDLDRLKAERGQDKGNGRFVNLDGTTGSTIKAAAEAFGESPERVRRAVNRRSEEPSHLDLPADAAERRPLTGGGKESFVIDDMELQTWNRRVKKALEKGVPEAWELVGKLVKRFGGETAAGQREFNQCVACWVAIEKLTRKDCLVEIEAKSAWNTRPRPDGAEQPSADSPPKMCKKLLRRKAVEVETVRRLWEETCSVEAGEALLKDYLKDGPRLVRDVWDYMHARGFTGLRLRRALKKANVQHRLSAGRGSPWVYYLKGQQQRANGHPPASPTGEYQFPHATVVKIGTNDRTEIDSSSNVVVGTTANADLLPHSANASSGPRGGHSTTETASLLRVNKGQVTRYVEKGILSASGEGRDKRVTAESITRFLLDQNEKAGRPETDEEVMRKAKANGLDW